MPQLRSKAQRIKVRTLFVGLLVWWGAGGALAHEVVPPKPVAQPAPAWPTGRPYSHDVVVPVLLTVAADGTVSAVEIEASLGQAFDAAAVAAARGWQFAPATTEGKPIAAKIRGIVRFVGTGALDADAGAAAPLPPAAAPADLRDAAAAPPASTPEPPTSETGSGPASGVDREGSPAQATKPVEDGSAPGEIQVVGQRGAPPRSASETTRGREIIQAAPHRTGGDLLQIVPGVFITQHSGQGKAYQVFYRGFDAVHGQDLEFWVGGAPVNEVSNLHGQGYADLHFVMPEVVSELRILPGNYSPEQGDFAVAGSIRYDLGYAEPGVTAKGTFGSFGERRAFLAYHPEGEAPASFAAFEAQSTDGFGPARAANRTSGIAQHIFKIGADRLRVLATGYASRFDSPGVVRLADIETGKLGRFDTYGVNQGGFSSRYQIVTEYSGGHEGTEWAVAPYAIARALRLKQNYTGFLVRSADGDTTQQVNEGATVGLTGHYRRPLHLFSSTDDVEAGISVRNDWIQQSELDLGSVDERVLSTVVKAKIRATDVAGWVNLSVRPTARLAVRAGARVDGLAFGVQDDASASQTRPGGTDSTAFSQQIRPPGPGGQARAAMGMHVGPRLTVDGTLLEGLHGVLSYGEGFRSPQARSLGDGEKTPFTTVRSVEGGLRFGRYGVVGSISAFRTALSNDLVFDPSTTRNEPVPASTRLGAAAEAVYKPMSWLMGSGSATWTRATFSESDALYHVGDKLPYVPEVIARADLALTPVLGELLSRRLMGRFGLGLMGMFRRPQPYGVFGHDAFLVDAMAELRLKEAAVGVDVFNLFDATWYDSEFTFSANWTRGATPSLVPERYVTAGAPRTVLATVSLFVN